MNYDESVFLFDCREEAAPGGVLLYSKLREIFFDNCVSEEQSRNIVESDNIDELGHIFAEAVPRLEKLLGEHGITIDMHG